MKHRTMAGLLLLLSFALGAATPARAVILSERVSNPGALPGQADGLEPGGDRSNSYAWCMDVLPQADGDYLYVGSNRDLFYLFLFAALQGGGFENVTMEQLLEVFLQGDVATTTDLRGRVFRYPLAGGEWQRAYTSPLMGIGQIPLPNGSNVDIPRDIGYRGALTFDAGDGPEFYLVTISFPIPNVPTTTRVLRFPADFDPAVPGQNTPEEVLRLTAAPGTTNSLRPLAEHAGKLYVGSQRNDIYESTAPPVQAPAGGFPPPSATAGWNLVATDADFNNAWTDHKYFAWEMASFNDYLYLVVGSIEPDAHETVGFFLYKGHADAADPDANQYGWVWEEIVGETPGAKYPPGIGRASAGVASLCAFGDHVFVGTYTDVLGPLVRGGLGSIIENVRPPRLFRFDRDDEWEMVVGDPRPESDLEVLRTRVGNYDAGFYNRTFQQMLLPEPWNELNLSLNQYIWWLEAHEGKLYASTLDVRVFLRYITDETLILFGVEDPAERQELLDMLAQLQSVNDNQAGFDLYVSGDGLNWAPVTRDGFGDPYNYGGRVLLSTDEGLFVGTANPFYGCQVWKLNDVAGGGSGGGCFVATAAFGSPLAGQVDALRAFRDRFLLASGAGQRFTAWYYRHGPAAARWLAPRPAARQAARLALYPLVGLALLLVNPWFAAILAGLAATLALCLRLRATRRRTAACPAAG